MSAESGCPGLDWVSWRLLRDSWPRAVWAGGRTCGVRGECGSAQGPLGPGRVLPAWAPLWTSVTTVTPSERSAASAVRAVRAYLLEAPIFTGTAAAGHTCPFPPVVTVVDEACREGQAAGSVLPSSWTPSQTGARLKAVRPLGNLKTRRSFDIS